MKNNERGYTLIELLIAITILAIIAIPLMHGFVTASKTNAKARQIEQATIVARNVMEEIEATPVEKLLNGITPNIQRDELGNVEGLRYDIVYNDVESDGVLYRANVTIDTGAGVDSGIPMITDYNHTELARLYDMNAAHDAFFILERETDQALIDEFVAATGDSANQVRDHINRTIYVDIRDEAGAKIVEVNVAYTYQSMTRYMAAQNQCIFSANSASSQLRNVYVFFSPLLDVSVPGVQRETVTVRNACCTGAASPVQIYLVKQGVAYDENYKVDVNVMEQSRDITSYKDAEGNRKVMTGVCTNLSFPRNPSDPTADQITLRYSTWDGDYRENVVIQGENDSADEITGLTSLAAEAKQDWIYNVYVEVRKKDADENDDALVCLTGTKEK